MLCPAVVSWQREVRTDLNCDAPAGGEALRGDERMYAIVEHYKTEAHEELGIIQKGNSLMKMEVDSDGNP